jgi:uncharacterized protein (DUF1501 family)
MRRSTNRASLYELDRPSVVDIPSSVVSPFAPRMVVNPRANGPLGDILIVVFQRGGMDGLAAVAPVFEGANYYDKKPFTAIPEPGEENGGLVLDGQFVLHPGLTAFKELYDSGKLAIVHACGLTNHNRSHFDAEKFMEVGSPTNKALGSGWIGRHIETSTNVNPSPFRAIGIQSIVQTSLRGTGQFSALALPSIRGFRLRIRGDQVDRVEELLKQYYNINAPTSFVETQAKLTFDTIETLREISEQNYEPANDAEYPNTGFGRSMRSLAQLIKAEVGLEVGCVDIGGWDTHETQGTINGTFNRILREMTNGIAALLKDLGDISNNVTVVTMSEFGRRVEENDSRGTDHGHGNVMFVAGGGVNGGKVYGTWPGMADDLLDDGDLDVTTDFRDILSEIVSKRLLNPLVDQVFPQYVAPTTPLNIVRQRV